MTDWLHLALEDLREHQRVVLVTVCAVEGSAPREAGAKMIVTPTTMSGTIGGGALEFAAIAHAREMLAADTPKILLEDFPLGPALGQCCGGHVRIGFEVLQQSDADWLAQAVEIFDDGGAVRIERAIANDANEQLSATTVVAHASKNRSPDIQFLDAKGAPLKDAMLPLERCHGISEIIADLRPRIYVFGAGHVGAAMIMMLARLPVAATWIDRRAERMTEIDAGKVNIIATDDEVAVARSASVGASFVVVTHSHQLDYNLVHEILQRGDSAYCGLIGSQTKRSRFERRMHRAGVGEEAIAHLTCPIGGGLESKDPAIIALCAIHEMLLAHEAYLMKSNG